VYGENGQVGVVVQVVIHPHDRLVTHVVVRSNETRDGKLATHQIVIPVTAIDLVNVESLFLVRNGLSIKDCPELDPDDYPLAPFTWKAPYPYSAGEVRWSRQEVLKAESQPSRPGMKPVAEVSTTPDRVMAQTGASVVSKQ
jgi:hypothetical protein